MKSLLFLVLFLVTATIAWKVAKQKDGFQDVTPPGASPGLNIPVISPRGQTLTKGEIKPFTEPSTALLAPPPGQASSVNSLPAEDPALQKSDARRLYSVYESLIGFFKNEAKGLQAMGDATVQLPMSTAKSDMTRLRDEMGAIDRNPGLESSLTQDDVNGIEANLGYLQKKWRLSANAAGAASPMPPFEEGFSCTEKKGAYGWFSSFFGGAQEGFQTATTPPTPPTPPTLTIPSGKYALATDSTLYMMITLGSPIVKITGVSYRDTSITSVPTSATGFTITWLAPNTGWGTSGVSTFVYSDTTKALTENTTATWNLVVPPGSGGSGSGSGSGAPCAGSSCKASLEDLTNLSTNIVAEIVRLQASGATDATTQNRMKLLSSILQQVNDLTSGLKNGTIKPDTVTITTGQIKSFLTDIKNPNSPLKNILADWGLPSGLSNLFPTYAAGDVSGADLAKDLFGKYVKDITNLSWDIGLSYKGKAEQEIAANYASAMKDARYFADTAGTPTASNSNSGASSSSSGGSGGSGAGMANNYRGLFDNVISSVTGQTPTVNAAAGATTTTTNGGMYSSTTTQPFDWKERAKQVCAQIKMRNMEPYDFGCLKDTNAVRQDNFSWRGYAKMICTRLATVYDPSIPELCGCPPPAWIGWRP